MAQSALNITTMATTDNSTEDTTIDNGLYQIPQSELKTEYVILGIILSVISFVSIFGNVLVLFVFHKTASTDVKSRYTVGMVYSSLLIGLFFLPLSAFKLVLPSVVMGNVWLCVITNCAQGFFAVNHVTNSCVTAVWNYIYVAYPLRASAWMTSTRVRISIITASLIPTIQIFGIYLGVVVRNYLCLNGVCSCAMMFYLTPISFVMTMIYGICVPCIIITVSLNTWIVHIAHRHIKNIRKYEASLNFKNIQHTETPAGNISNAADTIQFSNIEPENLSLGTGTSLICYHKEWRTVKLFGSFLMFSVLVWIPAFIIMNIVGLCHDCVNETLVSLCTAMAYGLASICAPIYFLSHSTYRQNAKKILLSKCYAI